MAGSLIRRARLERGLSQTALARLSGVDQPNISAIENGRRTPSADTLQALLRACGFQLAAVAGRRTIVEPVGDAELVPTPPERLSEDDRVRTVVAVLEASEAILRGR